MDRIIIIGGGLSGLTLAYRLHQQGHAATVLEAAPRLGGRIWTLPGTLGTPVEMGATWFSDGHSQLRALIAELGLGTFPQFAEGISLFQTKSFEPPQRFVVPATDRPSYRIAGGTGRLIEALARALPPDAVVLNADVISIREQGDELRVATADGMVRAADKVILCAPPRSAALRITFDPALPPEVDRILRNVHTWMAGSIKFALEYAEPFWRKQGCSGMLYSHAGIVVEMYDHSDHRAEHFVLAGFLNGGAAQFTQAVRRELVLEQVGQLLGEAAQHPVAYYDEVWTGPLLPHGEPVARPHENNGHPVLHQGYLGDRLFFAATETDTEAPGYMEGAVRAAQRMVERLVRAGQRVP